MTEASKQPPIVITMGDPSGVGPEVTVKALAALAPAERGRFAIVGDRAVLNRAIAASRVDLALGAASRQSPNAASLIDVPVTGLPERFGVLSPRCGEAAFRYIRTRGRTARRPARPPASSPRRSTRRR